MDKVNKKSEGKGFTLIELLIVISILVILAVVVILTLNPAQLLAQARDSQRLSDMSTLKSAIALYLADVTSPSMGTSSSWCYASAAAVNAVASTSACTYRYPNSSTSIITIATSSTPSNNNKTGWLPIDFTIISSGAPVGSDPVDPTNSGCGSAITSTSSMSACYMYTYIVKSDYTYKLTAHMESARYNSGPTDVENSDGGNNPYAYEVGTGMTL